MTVNSAYVRTAVLSSLLGMGATLHAADAKPPAAAPPRAPAANPPARPPTPPPSTPPNNNGPAPRTPAPQPPATTPPAANPGATTVNPPDRTSRTAENAQQQRRQHDRDTDPNRRTLFVTPLQTWAPYTWWYSGNSYWYPPLPDNYNGSAYGNSTARSTDDSTPAAVTPPQPAAAAEQAKALNGLEATPNYAKLVSETRKAQSTYDTASARVIEKLKSNEDYKALVAQRDRAEDKVEAVQASAKIPSPGAVTPAAQQKLNVSTRVTRMEQDAIAADPQASQAKARLVELTEALKVMRKQAEQSGVRLPE